MDKFLNFIMTNSSLKVLIVLIVLDVIFGVLRSFKEHKTNSTIGINGLIRKSGMLISTFFLFVIDMILQINFIKFIPQEILQALNLKTCGIGSVFTVAYILFESLSILKNMTLCDMPVPVKLKNLLEKITKELTNEIEDTKEDTTKNTISTIK